jgi:endonuclease/exonuclease/phosphatase (EEP) superfamily protein YafD
MRPARLALDLLLWPAVALAAAASLALTIAAQFGRVSTGWDIAAQFAPVWLVVSAFTLVAAFLFRRWLRWSVVALSVTGLALAATLIAPEYLRDAGPRAPAAAPGQLKIVQFNVWHENPDPEPILAWLDAERPDIAMIEENSKAFSSALVRHPGWSVACPHCEVLILSRTPALSVDKPVRRKGVPNVPMTHGVFHDAQGDFDVVGVHNAWPTDPDQAYQERRLAEFTSRLPKRRLIVTGDFNSSPWSFSRRYWDGVLGIARRERAIPTWPAQTYKRLKWLGLPFLPIDHVYAGPGWATVSVQRGPRLTSDHYPVVVTLAPIAPR